MNHKKRVTIFMLSALLLFSSACTAVEDPTVSPTPSPDISLEDTKGESGEVTLSATFYQEDGDTPVEGTARISVGGAAADYTLDEYGGLTVSGLPKKGTVGISLLNEQGQDIGFMELSISQGAVVDAAMDDAGVGHLTLREESTETALVFTLTEDGTLRCALKLSSPTAI